MTLEVKGDKYFFIAYNGNAVAVDNSGGVDATNVCNYSDEQGWIIEQVS